MDQLARGDGAEGVGDGAAARRAVARALQQVHLERRVILLLQVCAYLPELRQLQPAGLRGAAARHAVALTRAFHGALDRLGRELSVRSCKAPSQWPADWVVCKTTLKVMELAVAGASWIAKGCGTHLAASLVVVQIHGCPGILSCLQGIHKLLGNCLSEAHVVTAASPEPALAS